MKFPTNEAPIDRALRVVIGLVLGVAAIAAPMSAPLLYVALVVAAILVVTGIVGFCPLYAILRVSTKARTR